jgi:membrane protease YdiL (CAAX protease family)
LSRNIFLNDRHELRSGWKLATFYAIFILIWIASGIALSLWFAQRDLTDNQLAAIALNEIALLVPGLITPVVIARFVDHRPLSTFGITLQNSHWHLLSGLTIATAMTGIALAGSYLFGYVHLAWTGNQVPVSTLLATAAVLIVAAAVEELMFRGMPLQILCEGIGKWPGILVISGLFGAVHLNNPNSSPLGTVNTVLAGVLLSLAYFKARSLWLPYAIHLGWNAGIGFVLGMSLSGLDLASLWTTGVAGRDFILGGGYGPEGGLLTTFIFGVTALFVNRRNWDSYTAPNTRASRSAVGHQPE